MQAFRKKGRDFSLKPAEMLIHALDLAADAAVVVHNPSNMFYLSAGYTGEGVVYISRKTQAIITDFRYTEQAEQQAPTFRCVMTEKGMSHDQWVAKLAQEDGVSVFYYEDDYLTVKAFQALRDAIGRASAAEVAIRREQLDRELKRVLEEKVAPWGVTVLSVEVRDILLPKELQEVMSLEAQAEQRKKARIILMEAEHDIYEILGEMEELIGDHEAVARLRTMHLLNESLREGKGTVVIPSAFAEGFNEGLGDLLKG